MRSGKTRPATSTTYLIYRLPRKVCTASMPTPASISSTGVGIKKEMSSSPPSPCCCDLAPFRGICSLTVTDPHYLRYLSVFNSVQDEDARLSSPLGVGDLDSPGQPVCIRPFLWRLSPKLQLWHHIDSAE
jgi:hypothetical protein